MNFQGLSFKMVYELSRAEIFAWPSFETKSFLASRNKSKTKKSAGQANLNRYIKKVFRKSRKLGNKSLLITLNPLFSWIFAWKYFGSEFQSPCLILNMKFSFFNDILLKQLTSEISGVFRAISFSHDLNSDLIQVLKLKFQCLNLSDKNLGHTLFLFALSGRLKHIWWNPVTLPKKINE